MCTFSKAVTSSIHPNMSSQEAALSAVRGQCNELVAQNSLFYYVLTHKLEIKLRVTGLLAGCISG